MKKFVILPCMVLISTLLSGQNVGVGTTTPNARLDVKTVSNYVAQFNGGSSMYVGIFENDIYRGYWGSFSGAVPDVDFGTGAGNTSGSLHFAIQGVPKVSIDSIGRMGVGTMYPHYQLHVTNGDLFLQSNQGKFMFGYEGGNQWRLTSTNGGADLLWIAYNGSSETYKHNFSQNGYVGLGTGSSTPGAPLHIKGNTALMLKIEGAAPYAALYDNTDGYKGYWWYNGADVIHGSLGTSAIKMAPGNYLSTNFNADGRVSIGVGGGIAATGYLLSVKGKIICEEAKVQLSANWPDYVFDQHYKLMPLSELEKSIREQQHLPNIPAAKELETNGILLGDMNRRIMEKVEELTLYIIELNKKNEQLQKDVAKLKAANSKHSK